MHFGSTPFIQDACHRGKPNFLFWDSLTQKKVSWHPGGDWDPWWWVDPKYKSDMTVTSLFLFFIAK